MLRVAIALLIAMTLPVSAQNRDQPLIGAAEKGDLAAVERLIRDDASVMARDNRGRTALLAATQGNHAGVARVLIAAGADVNAKDDIQDSPFLYAGAEGRIEILKMTLAKADLKSTNRYGGTALIPAAHHGHPEAVRILLGTTIDKDHVNKLGWTALLEAVILGDGGPVHTEIVTLLTEAGANVNIADKEGVTPLAHAKRRGFAEMVRILEIRGAR
jgi:ankyrin repeat protein